MERVNGAEVGGEPAVDQEALEGLIEVWDAWGSGQLSTSGRNRSLQALYDACALRKKSTGREDGTEAV